MTTGIIYVPENLRYRLDDRLESLVTSHISDHTVFIVSDTTSKSYVDSDGVMYLGIESLGLLSEILFDFFNVVKRGVPLSRASVGLIELLSEE